MARRPDWWFLGEQLAALILLGLLGVLAYFSDARASGITNMLLASGGAGGSLSTTVTAEADVVSGVGAIGYCGADTSVCSQTFGSISSASLGGKTLEGIIDIESSSVIVDCAVIVSGFSSSPGASWLGNVTFNSHTFAGSSASFGYSGGTATWEWSTSTGWAFVGTDVYPGTVQYQ